DLIQIHFRGVLQCRHKFLSLISCENAWSALQWILGRDNTAIHCLIVFPLIKAHNQDAENVTNILHDVIMI
ncbi:hypothetical protein L208DRAFT_1514648, partial [Tricholoma matsutake]